MAASRWQLAVLAFVVLAVEACGTPIPDVPPGQPVSYSEHLQPLVLAHCLGCHESDEPKARLVLEEGVGFSQLVGRRSVQVPAIRD